MRQQVYLENAIEQLRENPTDDCVLWPFSKNKARDGYGQVTYDGEVNVLVHRLVYRLHYGKEPDQMILHKCGSHACFNPLHLYEGSAKQNIQDVIDERGYFPGGRRKLTEQDVIEVIEMLKQGMKQDEIAACKGVARATISFINTGRTWQHIPRDGKPPAKRRRSSKRAVILQYTGQRESSNEPETGTNNPRLRQIRKQKTLPTLSKTQLETAQRLRACGFKYGELARLFDLKLGEMKELLDAA